MRLARKLPYSQSRRPQSNCVAEIVEDPAGDPKRSILPPMGKVPASHNPRHLSTAPFEAAHARGGFFFALVFRNCSTGVANPLASPWRSRTGPGNADVLVGRSNADEDVGVPRETPIAVTLSATRHRRRWPERRVRGAPPHMGGAGT